MKRTNTFRIILLTILILGLFASWAQNDYGNTLISLALFGISISFFIQAFRLLIKKQVYAGKAKAFYFIENFCIAAVFYSISAKLNWIIGSSAVMVLAVLILVILYFILAGYFILRKKSSIKLENTVNFVFILSTIIALAALVFHWQHWPYVKILNAIFYGFIILLMTLLLFSWKSSTDTTINYFKFVLLFIKNQKGHVTFVFSMLTILFLFGLLTQMGFNPKLYNNSFPPELVKLKNEQSPRADVYEENYFNFLESRGDLDEDK